MTVWKRFAQDPLGFVTRGLYKTIMGPIVYRGPDGYDAARYWRDRFLKHCRSFKAVGDEGLSNAANRRVYAQAATAFADRYYLARLSRFFVLLACLGERFIRYRRRAKRYLGFTFVELLMCVAIVGTLVGISLPRLHGAVQRAKVAHAIGDITALQQELLGDETHETLPEFLSEIGHGNMLDPWGNPYVYMNFGTSAALDQQWGCTEGGTAKPRKDRFLVPLNTYYDLYSKGEDGDTDEDLQADKSRDDIVRANDGGYVGLAANY